MAISVPAPRLEQLAEFRLSKRMLLALELAAAGGIFVVAIVVRLWRLGTVPRIIAGDETDNIQVAYHIIAGTGPGIFGFDWKPAPIFSLYPLAWTIQTFGDSVADFRLFPVILSLLVIAMFYVVARESMGAPAALLALGLLVTNLWFLHFSRTAWENANASFFALGACWSTTRALKTGRMWLWALTGLFVAFGLYGYFSGRFIFVSVALIAAIAVAMRWAPWKRTLMGLGLAAVISAALFAPMAYNIARDWDYFNQRTKNASIFTSIPNAQTKPDNLTGWPMAWYNVKRNYNGWILMRPNVFESGLWSRYTPKQRAPLGFIAMHLFWAGLLVAVFLRWRDTFAWWTFLAPLAIAQIFSRGTPDLARGLIFAPFYFLFIGIALDEGIRRLKTVPLQAAAVALAAVAVIWVGVLNVRDYFEWQESPSIQALRLPGVDVCEFADWQKLAHNEAKRDMLVRTEQVEAMREQNRCSEIVSDVNRRNQ